MGKWVTTERAKVRLATIDDIVPNEKRYYLKTAYPNVFHRTEFSSLCDWDMIVEMVERKYVYAKD